MYLDKGVRLQHSHFIGIVISAADLLAASCRILLLSKLCHCHLWSEMLTAVGQLNFSTQPKGGGFPENLPTDGWPTQQRYKFNIKQCTCRAFSIELYVTKLRSVCPTNISVHGLNLSAETADLGHEIKFLRFCVC